MFLMYVIMVGSIHFGCNHMISQYKGDETGKTSDMNIDPQSHSTYGR